MPKNIVRMSACLFGSALLAASPAAAQVPDPVGICVLFNFQFCEQPAAPVVAPEVMPPPPSEHAADHRKHRRKQNATTPNG